MIQIFYKPNIKQSQITSIDTSSSAKPVITNRGIIAFINRIIKNISKVNKTVIPVTFLISIEILSQTPPEPFHTLPALAVSLQQNHSSVGFKDAAEFQQRYETIQALILKLRFLAESTYALQHNGINMSEADKRSRLRKINEERNKVFEELIQSIYLFKVKGGMTAAQYNFFREKVFNDFAKYYNGLFYAGDEVINCKLKDLPALLALEEPVLTFFSQLKTPQINQKKD